jgi:hypothetical protein
MAMAIWPVSQLVTLDTKVGDVHAKGADAPSPAHMYLFTVALGVVPGAKGACSEKKTLRLEMATERATSAVDAVPMATGAPAPVASAGFAFPPAQVMHMSRGCEEPSTVKSTYSVPMGAGESTAVVTL